MGRVQSALPLSLYELSKFKPYQNLYFLSCCPDLERLLVHKQHKSFHSLFWILLVTAVYARDPRSGVLEAEKQMGSLCHLTQVRITRSWMRKAHFAQTETVTQVPQSKCHYREASEDAAHAGTEDSSPSRFVSGCTSRLPSASPVDTHGPAERNQLGTRLAKQNAPASLAWQDPSVCSCVLQLFW